MSEKYIHGFAFTLGTPLVFHWEDDSGLEDMPLCTYLSEYWSAKEVSSPNSPSYRDFEVDRTGTDTVLIAQKYIKSGGSRVPSGSPAQVVMVEGRYMIPWQSGSGYTGPTLLSDTPGDFSSTAGTWECDQFGRPFDLNDLLA